MRVLLLILALAGLARPLPAAAADPELSAGRLLAERECGACHAVGFRGESPLADAPPFRELRGRVATETLARLLADRMRTGHPRMPRVTLDPDELAHLLAYWESLPPPEQAEGGPVGRIRRR